MGIEKINEEIVAAVWIMALVLTVICQVVIYIIRSLALMRMASRRGLPKPWLAWIPVGSEYMLGCIYDDIRSQRGVGGFALRTPLATVSAMSWIVNIASWAGWMRIINEIISMVSSSSGTFSLEDFIYYFSSMTSVSLQILLWLAQLVSLVLQALQLFFFYTVSQEYLPSNAVIYVALSIFMPFLIPFFLFFMRNKEPYRPHRPTDSQNPYQ